MEVCVKQGEIVNKHLKLEMIVGDVLCFGLDEQLVRLSTAATEGVCTFILLWRVVGRCSACQTRQPVQI